MKKIPTNETNKSIKDIIMEARDSLPSETWKKFKKFEFNLNGKIKFTTKIKWRIEEVIQYFRDDPTAILFYMVVGGWIVFLYMSYK